MTGLAIPRASEITADVFHRDFVQTRTPVVLTGQKTQTTVDWDAKTVADTLGDQEFYFKRSANDAHPNFRGSSLGEMFAREKMTFREFFARVTEGPKEERCRYIFTGDEHYLARTREGVWSVNPALEPLWRTVRVPHYVPSEIYSAWCWFSGVGAHTWLHYDNNGCHNLNVQLHGQKRCILFPPSSLRELAFFEPGGPVPAYNCSQLDLASSEGAAALSRVPHYETTLRAGEMLFIPAHWIHALWHEGAYNANVNFWWKPRAEELPQVHDNDVARRELELHTHE